MSYNSNKKKYKITDSENETKYNITDESFPVKVL